MCDYDSSRQAGAITPAMIEAGVAELNSHFSDDFRVLADEEIVRRLFLAMIAARQQPQRATSCSVVRTNGLKDCGLEIFVFRTRRTILP